MSEATIRAQIKIIMEGVSGIGVVHSRKRVSTSLAGFFKLMTSGTPAMINGWMIHRQATPSERGNMPTIDRFHTYKILGLYDLDDENDSDSTFQALIEAIFDAFKSNLTLNGTALNSDPINIDNIDEDEYVHRLFHTCELTLTVHDRATY
jgi:hypothetical protein